MAQAFYPTDSIIVPATTPPHPPGMEYKVAIGFEMGETPEPVKCLKIQMVYNGKILGRRIPTFLCKEDCERVYEAIKELLNRTALSTTHD